MVEVALIKLTRPSMEPDLDSVLQRLKQLEAAVEDLEAGGFRPGTMVTAPMGAVPVTAGVQPQISGTQGQMAVPVQGGPTAVSYTHLDVYKRQEEYPRFFYRGYDIEETLNELKITYTFEIEGLSAFTPTWTFPKNGNPEAKWRCV